MRRAWRLGILAAPRLSVPCALRILASWCSETLAGGVVSQSPTRSFNPAQTAIKVQGS